MMLHQRNYQALASLAKTQRRFAHEAKHEALEAVSKGNLARYEMMRAESDRLWQAAKFHLDWAKRQKVMS
jgi:hypothetical protein